MNHLRQSVLKRNQVESIGLESMLFSCEIYVIILTCLTLCALYFYHHAPSHFSLSSFSCPNTDDNYLTKLISTSSLPFPGHHRRFLFKMFTFMTETVYEPGQKLQSDSPPIFPSKELV